MTSEELMLCLFDSPYLSVWELGNNVSLITISIALLAWSFFDFWKNTSHLAGGSYKYVGSIPITDGMTRIRYLIPLLVPEFIEPSLILKIGTMPVWAKKWFCWVGWFLTVIASVDWIKPWEMKWMFVLDGGRGSKTEDFMRIYLRTVEWAGWHYTSYATVVTRFVSFPNPIRFVNKSIAGKMTLFLFFSGSFSSPSGLRLLLWLWVASPSVVFCSAIISSWERSTFISAVEILFFAIWCRVSPVLTYLMKPILVSRWVGKWLRFSHVFI